VESSTNNRKEGKLDFALGHLRPPLLCPSIKPPCKIPFFFFQVVEARRQGDNGERERQLRAAQEVAIIKATIVKKKNQTRQRVAMSEKELAVVRAECKKEQKLADIDVFMATKKRKAELGTEVDRARTQQQIAFLQSTQVRGNEHVLERTLLNAFSGRNFWAHLKRTHLVDAAKNVREPAMLCTLIQVAVEATPIPYTDYVKIFEARASDEFKNILRWSL
jgi:hypothetical protein